jgi:hypothetical protein
MTIDEAIKHCEEVAEEQDKLCKRYDDASGYSRSHNEAIRTTDAKRCKECAAEHRRLAEWLKELKERREIQDILLQFLVDDELDICCDELAEDEEEWEICGKNCNNKTKECWLRWAKMKAREVNDVND